MSRLQLCTAVLFLLALFILGIPAYSMDFMCLGPVEAEYESTPGNRGTFFHILAKGEIVAGDFERLKAAMERLKVSTDCGVDEYTSRSGSNSQYVLQLDSPGGNLIEGLDIANYVIDSFMATYVAENAECLSACALVFMAGVRSVGDGFWIPSRLMHYTARVGVHSPFLPEIDLNGLPPNIVKTVMTDAYKQAIDAAARLTVLAMNAKWQPGFVNVVLRTPPDRFVYVDTIGKAGDWDIDLQGLDVGTSRDEASLSIACVNFYFWSQDDAGLTPNLETMIDPSKPFSPTHEEFDTALDNISAQTRQDEELNAEVIGFGNDWDGEWCSFVLGSRLENKGGPWWRPVRGTDFIPGYVKLVDAPEFQGAQQKLDERNAYRQAFHNRLWDHNGSVMESVLDEFGNLKISYQEPRPGLSGAGVEPGTLLFGGRFVGWTLTGDAWLFSSRGCPRSLYKVSTSLLDVAGTELVLRGAVPILNANCQTTGTKTTGGNANLKFTLLK